MCRIKKIINVFIALLCIAHLDLQGIVYGSDTATTIQSFVTFPQTDTTNTMLGFGRFSNGFGLQSATTTCTFNDFLPVDSAMVLNGGTLYLKEDLFLDSQLVVSSLGTIVGNNHCITFAPHTQTIVFPYVGTLNQITAGSTNYCQSVGWSADDQYVGVGVKPNPAAFYVYSFNGSTMTPAANLNLPGYYDVWYVAWRPVLTPPPYYVATATDAPAGVYVYKFTPPASLTITSTAAAGSGTRTVAWHPSGNLLAFGNYFATTQQILLYNFDASTGLLSTNTSYSFPASITFLNQLDFDYSGSYLTAAFGNSNQVQVLSWNGTSLTPVASAVDITQNLITAKWSPDGTLIAVGGTNGSVHIFGFNRSTQTLTSSPVYSAAYPGGVYIYKIAWHPNGKTLAVVTTSNLQLFTINKSTQQLVLTGVFSPPAANNPTVDWTRDGLYLAANSTNPPNPINAIYIFNLLHNG